jgi:Na+/H+-dicarboxylate symporter
VSRPGRHVAYLVAGVVGGFLAGALAGAPMRHVAVVGELFLMALQMLVVPLVMASLVTGVASLSDRRGFGRTLRVTVAYFLATMAIAVSIGILLVTAIRPGDGIVVAPEAVSEATRARAARSTWENVQDLLRSFLSPNLFAAMSDGRGIVAVILFSMGFGAVLGGMGTRGRALRDVFETIDAVLVRMISWVVLVAPVGVFALVAARIGATGGGAAVWDHLRALGLYAATVVVGLVLHATIVLPAALRLLGGRRPLPYARGVAPALLVAFGTASSSATLPVTLECVTKRNGVGERAARFVAPVGATLNMNGTALYEAVAAIFIAQAYGIALGPVELGLVAVTSVLAAMGAAAIPEAGLVTMVMVLAAARLPAEGIGLILSIDWLLDRCRTAVNVWDDAVGAAVVERLAGLDEPAAEPAREREPATL